MKRIILIAIIAFSLNAFAQVTSNITVGENMSDNSFNKNINGTEIAIYIVNENSNEGADCKRCENSGCVTMRNWWGTGSYDKDVFYSKATNHTDQTITYKFCVLKKDGYWSCGTDQIGAYATSSTWDNYNIKGSGETILMAAYGDRNSHGCVFPDPNK